MTILEKIKILIGNTIDDALFHYLPIRCSVRRKNLEKCLNPNCNNMTDHWSGYCSNSCCKEDEE